MSFYDDKPKNDYSFDEKPKNDLRERGGCLTFYIGFIAVVNVLMIGLMVVAMGGAQSAFGSDAGFYQMLFGVQIVISGVLIASAYGLWQWKQWGYYGLLVTYVLTMLINVFTGEIPASVGGLVGIAILFYVMREKQQYLN